MLSLAHVQRVREQAAAGSKRRIHFVINGEAGCADLLEFLEALPPGTESAWWRGIAKRWLAQTKREDLEQAVTDILNEASASVWRVEPTKNNPSSCSV
nr:hypothetical protein [uncultured Roseateles sp.]